MGQTNKDHRDVGYSQASSSHSQSKKKRMCISSKKKKRARIIVIIIIMLSMRCGFRFSSGRKGSGMRNEKVEGRENKSCHGDTGFMCYVCEYPHTSPHFFASLYLSFPLLFFCCCFWLVHLSFLEDRLPIMQHMQQFLFLLASSFFQHETAIRCSLFLLRRGRW